MNIKKIKEKSKLLIRPYYKKLSSIVLFNFYFHMAFYLPYQIFKHAAKSNPAVYQSLYKTISIVYLAVSLLIIPIFSLSYLILIAKIANKKDSEVEPDISFKAFLSNFKYAFLAIGNNFWTILWLVIWCIPAFTFTYAFVHFFFSLASVLGIIVYLLAIFGFILYKYCSYFMNSYAIANDTETQVFEAMDISKRITKGHRWEIIKLSFSFIGYSLLVTLTLGIASIWVTPYISMTYFNVYKELSVKASRHEEKPEVLI